MGTQITTVPRCVILGGGEIVDYAAVTRLLHTDDFVLCADSGYRHCDALGLVPQLLLGDFDSIGLHIPAHIPRLDFPAEKNYTDSTLAIETAVARGFRRLLLCGMLGGRLDHSLANLQNLAACALRGIDACITDGRTHARALHKGKLVLQPMPGYYFSLICLSEQATGVNIYGAKYTLRNHTLTYYSPRAVSNEFLSGPVTITVAEGTLLVLCVPMDTPQKNTQA